MSPPSADVPTDADRVRAILAGDARAFGALVDENQASFTRVARSIVRSPAVVEEVVQEAWLAILQGLAAFEGRSSLRTWMLRILVNRARTRAVREARTVPFSALSGADDEPVDADRFDARGHWKAPPGAWSGTPESLLADRQLVGRIEAAIEDLPERQRLVVVLRDIDGWSSEEVRNALELSETNQRVLLHRARARIRAALEPHLSPTAEGP